MYRNVGLVFVIFCLQTVLSRRVRNSQDEIQVAITCDNDLWFYADGHPVVDSSTPGQNNWRVTKHVSVPADTKVLGVKCVDHGVVAGVIASLSDGRATDGGWRCINTAPGANWLSENYDDSSWQVANTIHTNDKPSPYWGVRSDISSKAQWIWTQGWRGQDKTVYCRKVIEDEIQVNITCDNELWFYADGKAVVDSNTPGQKDWRDTKHVSVPADTKVYGIKCVDYHVVGGIIASFSDGSVTDKGWRCTSHTPSPDWLSPRYDDWDWQAAHAIHTNNAPSQFWGRRPDISNKAQWIWTDGWHGQHRTVYCRKLVGKWPAIRPELTVPVIKGTMYHEIKRRPEDYRKGPRLHLENIKRN